MAEILRIHGGERLSGPVEVSGAKNAAVAMIPAALLTDEVSCIENLPDIHDVWVLIDMLRALGADVEFKNHVMHVNPKGVNKFETPRELAEQMRASYYFLPVLLHRFGRAKVPLPGGCAIGARPIDQTIKGLKALGAECTEDFGYLTAEADNLVGDEVFLDMPSVGATINTMLGAVLANGRTVIHNAAREPHVVDLANFLNSMGGRIRGAGTEMIRVVGVPSLHGTCYTVIPDQIETGTFMLAAAATHGDVDICGVIPAHMESLTSKMLEMGITVNQYEDVISVRGDYERARRIDVKTQYYPGFPTDLQQPLTALLCTADGQSEVCENIYENRFGYCEELIRMGAHIRVRDRIAVTDGVKRLYGCSVRATDLRAGAALVVAALGAEGVTEISNVHFLDRGYEHIEEKLCSLGAKIERLTI